MDCFSIWKRRGIHVLSSLCILILPTSLVLEVVQMHFIRKLIESNWVASLPAQRPCIEQEMEFKRRNCIGRDRSLARSASSQFVFISVSLLCLMIKYIHSLTLQKYIAFEGVYILIDFIMYCVEGRNISIH